MATIQTVTGPIDSADLGRTLMHEHLAIGYPGWESATNEHPDRDAMLRICVDRIAELQDLGYRSLVDPCPSDLGRDPELMVAAAEATGFNIICATGLYHEAEGGHAHWDFRARFEDIVPVMAEVFTRELVDGIGTTGVRPGIIKVATGPHRMSDYERKVFLAAASAAIAIMMSCNSCRKPSSISGRLFAYHHSLVVLQHVEGLVELPQLCLDVVNEPLIRVSSHFCHSI